MDISSLPNDILDVIYHKKHNIEMIDICSDIIFKQKNDIDILMKLIIYFENTFSDPKSSAFIWIALRNEGIISNIDLNYMINRLEENFSILNDELCNLNEYTKNYTISIREILKENDVYIRDALMMYEDSENWILDNII